MVIHSDKNMLLLHNQSISRYFKNLNIKVIGMDFYHKGLNDKRPIGLISFVSQTYRCIPLCFSILQNVEYDSIKEMIEKIKQFYNLSNKVKIMMDNSNSQKKAVISCGLKYLLCKFHLLQCLYIIILVLYNLNINFNIILGWSKNVREMIESYTTQVKVMNCLLKLYSWISEEL